MAVQIPPGFATFAVEHWLVNYPRPAVCVWGLDYPAGVGDPVLAANQIQSAYIAAFAPGIDSNVIIRSSRLTLGQDASDPIVATATTSGPGTAVRDSTAPALAVMLDLHTSLGGRRNRGRKYVPWAANDTAVSEQGAIEGGTVTAWNTRGATWISNLAAMDVGLVVLHGTGSSPVPAPTPVTSITTNPVIRTQRNRQTRF